MRSKSFFCIPEFPYSLWNPPCPDQWVLGALFGNKTAGAGKADRLPLMVRLKVRVVSPLLSHLSSWSEEGHLYLFLYLYLSKRHSWIKSALLSVNLQ